MSSKPVLTYTMQATPEDIQIIAANFADFVSKQHTVLPGIMKTDNGYTLDVDVDDIKCAMSTVDTMTISIRPKRLLRFHSNIMTEVTSTEDWRDFTIHAWPSMRDKLHKWLV